MKQNPKKIEKKITKAKLKKLEKKEVKKQFLMWSKKVKTRDNNRCVICSSTGLLHTHHLIPRENKIFRFDLDNGLTLCPSHHKFSLEISAHRNPLQFYLWFQHSREEQFSNLYKKLLVEKYTK